jgi:hypothetical protein
MPARPRFKFSLRLLTAVCAASVNLWRYRVQQRREEYDYTLQALQAHVVLLEKLIRDNENGPELVLLERRSRGDTLSALRGNLAIEKQKIKDLGPRP